MTKPRRAKSDATPPFCATSAVAAVVTICSKRKTGPAPPPFVRAESLPRGATCVVAEAWLRKVGAALPQTPASRLYAGRGFGLAREAADCADAPLHVISAGLGLVRHDMLVPHYGLTVSGLGEDSVGPKIKGTFSLPAWFDAISRGPYSIQFEDVFKPDASGVVLIALTRPYAKLVGEALDGLPADAKLRLRLFGANITSDLPPQIQTYVMPYDERLDSLAPGTRGDFAQRALADFAKSIVHSVSDASAPSHAQAVRVRLHGLPVPVRPERPRLTDTEILKVLERQASAGAAINLRTLRHVAGVACEARRFQRLKQHLQAIGVV